MINKANKIDWNGEAVASNTKEQFFESHTHLPIEDVQAAWDKYGKVEPAKVEKVTKG
jgi:hypothetical protein